MTGWQRLKLVLSVLYWASVGGLVWMAASFGPIDAKAIVPILLVAVIVYAIAAAIWWAFAGFSNQK